MLAEELRRNPGLRTQILAELQRQNILALVLFGAGGYSHVHERIPISADDQQVIGQALAEAYKSNAIDLNRLVDESYPGLRALEGFVGIVVAQSGDPKLIQDFVETTLRKASQADVHDLIKENMLRSAARAMSGLVGGSDPQAAERIKAFERLVDKLHKAELGIDLKSFINYLGRSSSYDVYPPRISPSAVPQPDILRDRLVVLHFSASPLTDILRLASSANLNSETKVRLFDTVVKHGDLSRVSVAVRSELAKFFASHSREFIEHFASTGREQVSRDTQKERWNTLSQFFRSVMFGAPPISDEATVRLFDGLANGARQIREAYGLETAARILGRLDGTISHAFVSEVASRKEQAKAVQEMAKQIIGIATGGAAKALNLHPLAAVALKMLGDRLAEIASKPFTPETLAGGQNLDSLRSSFMVLFGILNPDSSYIPDGNPNNDSNTYAAVYESTSQEVRNRFADTQISYTR
ncbi:MAG: hypothetical protein NZ585_02145 [Chloracidobacterium sp.]|nr:hypothetical protein [Chloracidobacterium sp.]MDW8218670.1 hypothetical protein [Acidobacteriota bacterium]